MQSEALTFTNEQNRLRSVHTNLIPVLVDAHKILALPMPFVVPQSQFYPPAGGEGAVVLHIQAHPVDKQGLHVFIEEREGVATPPPEVQTLRGQVPQNYNKHCASVKRNLEGTSRMFDKACDLPGAPFGLDPLGKVLRSSFPNGAGVPGTDKSSCLP